MTIKEKSLTHSISPAPVATCFGIRNISVFSSSFKASGGDGFFIIENGRIKDCGQITERPDFEEQLKNKNVQWLDGSGYMVIPGMINSHTHVAMSFFRDFCHGQSSMISEIFFPVESHLTKEWVRILSASSILSGLRSGTTTFGDHYYLIDGVVEALESFHVRGVVGETFGDLGTAFPSGEEKWQAIQKQIENWNTSSRVRPALAPHAMDTVSPKMMEKIATFARTKNLPLHFHLSQTQSERNFCLKEYNKSPVRMAEDCGALTEHSQVVHLVSADDEDLKRIKNSNATIGFCPASQVSYEKLAPIEKFIDYGIPFTVATDCAASNDQMDLFSEMKIASLFMQDRLEITSFAPELLLNAVTTVPAHVFGLKAQGDFQKGFEADLVFVRDDLDRLPVSEPAANLIFSTQSSHVDHVMIGGEWVLWKQRPVFVSVDDLKEEYLELVGRIKSLPGVKKILE